VVEAQSFYAAGYSPKEGLEIIKKSSLFKILSFGLGTSGLSDLSYLEKLIREKIPHNRIERLNLPVFVAASNITDGYIEYFNSGFLTEAVVASCSIPLVFKPVRFNDKSYVDGGFFDNMPIQPIRQLCKTLIAVNVNPNEFGNDPAHVLSIGQRCFDLTVWKNSASQIGDADIFIDVKQAAAFRLIDVHRADDLYCAGYEHTLKQIDEIKQKLELKDFATK